MTSLNGSSGYSGSPYVRKMIFSVGRWLLGIVNRSVGAVISQREHQSTLAIMRCLSHREPRNRGIHRGAIGASLEDALRYRASRQNP